MARFMISASKGTDDPTMATLPFIAAKVATEEGHQVTLWLQNEAVVLAKKGIVEVVQGVGLKPLKELATVLQAAQVPLWVCQACAVARQITESDLVPGASFKTMADYIKAVADAESNVSF